MMNRVQVFLVRFGVGVLTVATCLGVASQTLAEGRQKREQRPIDQFFEMIWPDPQRDIIQLTPPQGNGAGGGTAGVSAGMDMALGLQPNEPSVAVNPLNPLNVAVSGPASIRVSNDGGATFQPAVPYALPPMHNIAGNTVATFDSAGRLFVTFLSSPPGFGLDIVVSQLDPADGTTLGGYPVNVTASPGVNLPGGAQHLHDKPWIAADMNAASPFADRIYLLWTDFSLAVGGNVILTTYSTDQGLTWTPALMVSDSFAEGFVWPSNNYVANNGDLYIAYHSQPGFDNTANPDGVSGQMFVMRSIDGGVSFATKTKSFDAGLADTTYNVQTSGGAIPGFRGWMQPNVQPWVFADPIRNGRVYAISADDSDNNTTTAGNDPAQGGDGSDVYIAISENDGLTWGAPIRVDSGPLGTLQVFPSASIDRESGCLVINWYDNRAGLTNAGGFFLLDVYTTASTDGGMTFAPEQIINDVPFDPDTNAPIRFAGPPPTKRVGDYMHIAVVDCSAYAVWTGNTFSTPGVVNGQQIYFELSSVSCGAAAEVTPPAISCPADQTLECDQSTEPSVAGAGVANAADGCDEANIEIPLDEIALGGCPDSYTILRTWTATDANQSMSSCVQTIHVADTTAPVPTCPPVEITVECSDEMEVFSPSFADNCDMMVTTAPSSSTTPGTCAQESTIMQTVTATDNCENSSSCSRTVHVVDTGDPMITCPPNTSVSCEAPRTPTQTGSATATDLCDTSVTPTFSDVNSLTGCSGTGTIARTWRAEDDCGNVSTCVQTITVFDETDPMITCPANITRECGQSTAPAATGSATATDNCDTSVTPTSTDVNSLTGCDGTGTIARTWRAQDDCGNFTTCVQTITVQDTTGPTITCPANLNVQCGQSTAPAATGTATATDVCDASPTIGHSDSSSDGCGLTETITRTWTATDDCGRSNSCVQTITVVDTTLPTINCPADVVVTCETMDGVPVGDVQFIVSASDSCGLQSLTDNRPEGFYPPTCSSEDGGTIVTFVATDACNNVRACEVAVRVIGDACCPGRVETDTDLTLLPMNLDLRQDSVGPTKTKADFAIWNSNEVRFSGTHRCISCWDQTLFSLYGNVGNPGDPQNPNHFLLNILQTDKGKARIDGVDSTVCPESSAAPMLGLSIKEMKLNGSQTPSMRTAVPLVGAGDQEGRIQYDVIHEPGEASGPSFDGDSVVEGIVVVQGPSAEQHEDDGANSPGTAGILPEERASISNKGSLLVWQKVELRWNSFGELIQDSFITIANDNPGEVKVQFYFVQGDGPLDPVIVQGQLIERAHPGWNWVDNQITLTGDESAYWSVARGQPKGVSPFTILDPGPPAGRPDLDPFNPGGRILRGYVVGWAVNDAGREIRWNHLTGSAMILHYGNGTALDYESTAFRCLAGVAEGEEPDGNPGDLHLDGIEYSTAPNTLILDFFATPTEAFSHPDARE